MAIKRKKVAKKKTKKKKTKLVKVSKKKTRTKKKVATKKRSATKKPSKVSKKKNKIKNKKNREVKKMSTETVQAGKSPLLDTSHLKVKFPYKAKYGNFIGGKFVEPLSGKYFDNVSPINNEVICAVPRSDAKDVESALDAAHAAFPTWGVTSITERSNMLLKIADVIEKNLELLATAECLDNGKPIRECMAADLPLVIDHWRYFAGVIRAEEGSVCRDK